jgi:hypothetical protein
VGNEGKKALYKVPCTEKKCRKKKQF